MTNLFPSFNVGAFRSKDISRGSAPSILPTRVALSLLLMAAQVLTKTSALGFVRINMLVKRLLADGQSCCNFFQTPLHTQQKTGFFPYPRLKG
jgi:hypothetical protein